MILPCRIHRTRNRKALIRCRSRSFSSFCLLYNQDTPAVKTTAGSTFEAGWGRLAASYSTSNHSWRGHGLRRQRYLELQRRSVIVHQRKRCPHLRSPRRTNAIFLARCRTFYPVFRCDRARTRQPETLPWRLRITSRHGFPSTPAFTALTRTSPISNPMLVRRTCALPFFDTVTFFRLLITGFRDLPR